MENPVEDQQNPGITVGVDGSPVSIHAVEWAAAEAARRKRELTIVEAGYYMYRPTRTPGTATEPAYAPDVESSISAAEQAARAAEPELAVRTVVHSGDPVEYLVEVSKTSELLVLGTHVMSSLLGAVLGSLTQTVAAHARCPVVVINDQQPLGPEPRNRVVVGVSPSAGGRAALRFAFAEARSRGATLLAVRSLGDAEWASAGINYSGELYKAWKSTESETLESLLAEIAPEFPEVTVEKSLSPERPVDALADEALGAQLLVVGCHRSDDHWFSRLGSVASHLLHRAPCPLVVVGMGARPDADGSQPREVHEAHA
jgi:nucleotide-binding universal stress UspA family protein